MKDVIKDITEKLSKKLYKNEEEVRVGIVLRLLSALQWDIWNPREVSLEYKVTNEDNTKVDVALLSYASLPLVFIEVKNLGLINDNTLPIIERQLRNYNRDNTATFTIITDGNLWKFYLSQAGGTFEDKRFEEFVMINSTVDESSGIVNSFLSKENILNGQALIFAQEYLSKRNLQKTINNSYYEAKQLSDNPPFPSLVDALRDVIFRNTGVSISEDKAVKGILRFRELQNFSHGVTDAPILESKPETHKQIPKASSHQPQTRIYNNRDLRWAKIINASFGNEQARFWNPLVRIALKRALKSGIHYTKLSEMTGINITKGNPNLNGYNKVGYDDYYSLDIETTKSGNVLELLAVQLKCDLKVQYIIEDGPQKGLRSEISIK